MLDIKLKLKPGHTGEREWMEPSPLKTLFWNITYACNYRCGICFTEAGSRRPDELTTREALDLVRAARAAGVEDIIISGGEPFMRPDLVNILSRMKDLGISARIASNGSLLTEKLLDRLQRDKLTRSFQISLDTLDPGLYDDFHGTPPGTLERVIATLRQIRDRGFHTTISVRLTPRTLPGIPRLLDFASAEGLPTVSIHKLIHTGRAEGAFPQDEDVISRLDPVFEHFCSLHRYWLVEINIPWAEYHPVFRRLQKRVRVVYRGCRAGRDRLTIQPSGWISPCVCMDVEAAYLGNVRRDDLSEAFNRSPLCEIMRRPWDYGICPDCANVKRCGGGCRAVAYALTGELDGQDRSCPVWRMRASPERDDYGGS